jgi:hypothetical protein
MTERFPLRDSITRQTISAGFGYGMSSLKGKSPVKYGISTLVPAVTTVPLPFTMTFSYIMYLADQKDTLKTH